MALTLIPLADPSPPAGGVATATDAEPSNYVIVMREARLWLVGPFRTGREAVQWGVVTLSPIHDYWQTIQLADPHAPVPVLSPGDPGAVEGRT